MLLYLLQEMKPTRTFSRISPTWPPTTRTSWSATSSTIPKDPDTTGTLSTSAPGWYLLKLWETQRCLERHCPFFLQHHGALKLVSAAGLVTISNVAEAPFHQIVFIWLAAVKTTDISFKWRGTSLNRKPHFLCVLCFPVGLIVLS